MRSLSDEEYMSTRKTKGLSLVTSSRMAMPVLELIVGAEQVAGRAAELMAEFLGAFQVAEISKLGCSSSSNNLMVK